MRKKYKVERLLAWRAPKQGMVKLNTDGSWHAIDGFTTKGGVIRDHARKWLFDFAQKIRYCNIALAEFYVVFTGVQFCIQKGFHQVEINVGSQVAHIL